MKVLSSIRNFNRRNHNCQHFHTKGVKALGSVQRLNRENYSYEKFHILDVKESCSNFKSSTGEITVLVISSKFQQRESQLCEISYIECERVWLVYITIVSKSCLGVVMGWVNPTREKTSGLGSWICLVCIDIHQSFNRWKYICGHFHTNGVKDSFSIRTFIRWNHSHGKFHI